MGKALNHETTSTQWRPPLRTFVVRTVEAHPDGRAEYRDVEVTAHLVFNNRSGDRNEGLVFRRYYDDHVRTELVGAFEPGTFINVVEKPDGQSTRKR